MTIVHIQTGNRVYIKGLNKIVEVWSSECNDWITKDNGKEFRGSGQGTGFETYWDDGNDFEPDVRWIDDPEQLQFLAQVIEKGTNSNREDYDPVVLLNLPEGNRYRAEYEALEKKKDARSLLLEIARCPNIESCLTNSGCSHPCEGIVRLQGKAIEEHQVPEPWSGDLEKAPILFLSSNPSISSGEEFPTMEWADDRIHDFFTLRFDRDREWVKDGRYTLLKGNRGYNEKPVSYWTSIRSRVIELLDRDDVRPGIDYVLSEVVHCKSRSESHVSSALETCTDRYLYRLVAKSQARVIVCLGRVTRDAVCRTWWQIREDIGSRDDHGPVKIKVGQFDRYFVFLPHPNAFAPKTFAKCLSSEEIEQLKAILR